MMHAPTVSNPQGETRSRGLVVLFAAVALAVGVSIGLATVTPTRIKRSLAVATPAATDPTFRELVIADAMRSEHMLQNIYQSEISGGELRSLCNEHVRTRTELIAKIAVLQIRPDLRDSFLEFLRSENKLAIAIKTFEYGRLQLITDKEQVQSFQNYQMQELEQKWQAKVNDDQQHTAADRRAVLAALDEVVAAEKRFAAASRQEISHEVVYPKWETRIRNATETGA